MLVPLDGFFFQLSAEGLAIKKFDRLQQGRGKFARWIPPPGNAPERKRVIFQGEKFIIFR